MNEETVVQFGAPTLAGIKTGSLFSCLYDTKSGVYEDVRRLNRVLTPRGLCLLPLRFGEKRVLMYLFRPSGLETDLRCRGARRILRDAGYDDASMGKCMRCLIRRLRESESFPHEIGLFLSYPPEGRARLYRKQGAEFQAGRYLEGVRRRGCRPQDLCPLSKVHRELLPCLQRRTRAGAAGRGDLK